MVIPALNEAATIADVIARVPRDIPGINEVFVLVVDDGSTDETATLARNAGAEVVSHSVNKGVGAAFQTGVERALGMGAEYVVNMDGDGQFNPDDIRKLLAPLLEQRAEVATASRFMDPSLRPEMTRIKLYGNRMMSRLISRLCGKRFYDVSCGFRAYTRDALLRLNLFGAFTYTQETFLDLTFKGVPIQEVPVQVRGTREFGRSRVASNLFTYAFQTGKIIFRSYRDYRPMHLFGGIAAMLFLLSLALGAFFIGHYFVRGTFSPHIWAGMTSGALLGLGTLSFITGLVADMLARMRVNQERMLYLLKKQDR
ncbi:MAG: glycosyltransferase family 2 protein [Candidatus Hydrogenedentales bacterium]